MRVFLLVALCLFVGLVCGRPNLVKREAKDESESSENSIESPHKLARPSSDNVVDEPELPTPELPVEDPKPKEEKTKRFKKGPIPMPGVGPMTLPPPMRKPPMMPMPGPGPKDMPMDGLRDGPIPKAMPFIPGVKPGMKQVPPFMPSGPKIKGGMPPMMSSGPNGLKGPMMPGAPGPLRGMSPMMPDGPKGMPPMLPPMSAGGNGMKGVPHMAPGAPEFLRGMPPLGMMGPGLIPNMAKQNNSSVPQGPSPQQIMMMMMRQKQMMMMEMAHRQQMMPNHPWENRMMPQGQDEEDKDDGNFKQDNRMSDMNRLAMMQLQMRMRMAQQLRQQAMAASMRQQQHGADVNSPRNVRNFNDNLYPQPRMPGAPLPGHTMPGQFNDARQFDQSTGRESLSSFISRVKGGMPDSRMQGLPQMAYPEALGFSQIHQSMPHPRIQQFQPAHNSPMKDPRMAGFSQMPSHGPIQGANVHPFNRAQMPGMLPPMQSPSMISDMTPSPASQFAGPFAQTPGGSPGPKIRRLTFPSPVSQGFSPTPMVDDSTAEEIEDLKRMFSKPGPIAIPVPSLQHIVGLEDRLGKVREVLIRSFYDDLMQFQQVSQQFKARVAAKLKLLRQIESELAMPMRKVLASAGTSPNLDLPTMNSALQPPSSPMQSSIMMAAMRPSF